MYKEFAGVSNEIIDALWNDYDFSYEARLFLKAFNASESDSDDNLSEVCNCNGSNPEAFTDIGEKFPFLGINVGKIQKELMYESDDSGRLTGNYLDMVTESPSTTTDSRNGFINPNWFLYDIDVDSALKLW